MSLLETARQRARDSLAVLCPAGAVTWAQLACSMSDGGLGV